MKIWQDYKPLIIVVLFCLIVSAVQMGPFMYHFMGYFFVLLSMFKLFDLRGFVDGFSTYDFVAKRFKYYAYAYPFIELLLGLSYIGEHNLYVVNLLTAIIMIVSGISIVKEVMSGRKIKCACLGTALNVPLSTVSIIENFTMGLMAIYQLFFH